jgi:hypothetical protein
VDRQRLIIVVGSSQPVTSEQWSDFVTALDQELRNSGLGELLERPALKNDGDGPQESAVVLAHADYGRELVDRVTSEAGLQPRCSAMPQRWRAFNCGDYFASDLADRGYYDRESQYQHVWPRDRIYEDDQREFLVIGSPGCDGIEWGYRWGMAGIWAWYPIEAEFRRMASDVHGLLDGWLAGTIHV